MKESKDTIFASFDRRVKERYFWARLGVILLIIGFSCFLISIISFFLGIPFNIFYIFVNISLLMVYLGSISTLFLGRLGWSQSMWIDLLFNRLSIFLMFSGVLTGVASITFNKFFPQGLSYGYGITIIGVVLCLLGIRFQSSIKY